MKNFFYASLALAILIGAEGRAHAVSVSVTHDPLPSVINVGDIFTLDFTLNSDLGNLSAPSIKSYDFDISAFSKVKVKGEPPTSLLTVTGVTFSSYLGPGAIQTVTPLPSTTPTISEASILSDADLDLLQPDSFVILAVTFQAIAPGTGSLFSSIYNIAFTGGATLSKSAVPLANLFTVHAVPLPATLPLFAGALGGIGFFVSRRSKRRAAAA